MPSIRVVIDTREDDLWAALDAWSGPETAAARADGWWCSKATLDIADIAFFVGDATEPAVLLERKTADDLGASQRDGRYREQRARLLAQKGAGVAIGYVVEAAMPWTPTLSRSWCRGAFKEPALQTALVRLQLRYGIPVFQASSMRETVMWIRRIAGALHADPAVFREGLVSTGAAAAAAYTEAIHVKKAANMTGDRLLSTVLRTIPGCGPAAAEAIVQHVGTSAFPGFFALTEAELAAISMSSSGSAKSRKVGKATAAKLWAAFHTTGIPSDQTELPAESSPAPAPVPAPAPAPAPAPEELQDASNP